MPSFDRQATDGLLVEPLKGEQRRELSRSESADDGVRFSCLLLFAHTKRSKPRPQARKTAGAKQTQHQKNWIPAYAGMTREKKNRIPACAGMTEGEKLVPTCAGMTAQEKSTP